ncbi:MAG: DUF1934 domain-containing protein [Clostridia bacterium]|nr:DUF1934 domain-containing protein [Clostridia bacterium]
MNNSDEMVCKISITTTVDGEETQATRTGSLRISFSEILLSYGEENGSVTLKIQKDRAEITRSGDYSMRLPLLRERRTQGKIGVLGSEGDVEIYTERLAYSTTDTSLMLSMHYDLIFCSDVQKMQIRLLARS